MEVKSSPEPRQSVDESKPLQQAKTLLDTILGPQSSSLVTREWKPVPDHQGRTHYRLSLRDLTGEVSTDFAPDELENPLYMRVSLYRLWGDLLKIRSDQQHQRVQTLIGQMTSDLEGY